MFRLQPMSVAILIRIDDRGGETDFHSQGKTQNSS